jgi:hypothetical protein
MDMEDQSAKEWNDFLQFLDDQVSKKPEDINITLMELRERYAPIAQKTMNQAGQQGIVDLHKLIDRSMDRRYEVNEEELLDAWAVEAGL